MQLYSCVVSFGFFCCTYRECDRRAGREPTRSSQTGDWGKSVTGRPGQAIRRQQTMTASLKRQCDLNLLPVIKFLLYLSSVFYSSFILGGDECGSRKPNKWMTNMSIICCWSFSNETDVLNRNWSFDKCDSIDSIIGFFHNSKPMVAQFAKLAQLVKLAQLAKFTQIF